MLQAQLCQLMEERLFNMKYHKFIFLFAFLLISRFISFAQNTKRVDYPDFQKYIDSLGFKGTILILDSEKEIFYSNDFVWAEKGFLPASTFKIPNTLNALENKIIPDLNYVIKWDGNPRRKIWESDFTLAEAYKVSCVPCYQEIARKTGDERMHDFLRKIEYPGMRFGKDKLDVFWLQGESRISAFQQIAFLQKLVNKKLDLRNETFTNMKQIMFNEHFANFDLYGKTGWAIDGEYNIGWFVGYAETGSNTIYVATNITFGESKNEDDFITARKYLALKGIEEILTLK